MAQKKRKETETIERNMKDKTKSMKKTRRKKKEKEKETKKQKMVSQKVVKMEDTAMVKRKLVFCSKRKQTNERIEKEKSFVGGKRK